MRNDDDMNLAIFTLVLFLVLSLVIVFTTAYSEKLKSEDDKCYCNEDI